MPRLIDTSFLEAALIGYEAERQKIQQKIAEIQARLDGSSRRTGGPVARVPRTRGRRPMSAAARKRIADAQKKRWAAFHKKQKAA